MKASIKSAQRRKDIMEKEAKELAKVRTPIYYRDLNDEAKLMFIDCHLDILDEAVKKECDIIVGYAIQTPKLDV